MYARRLHMSLIFNQTPASAYILPLSGLSCWQTWKLATLLSATAYLDPPARKYLSMIWKRNSTCHHYSLAPFQIDPMVEWNEPLTTRGSWISDTFAGRAQQAHTQGRLAPDSGKLLVSTLFSTRNWQSSKHIAVVFLPQSNNAVTCIC